MLVCEALGLKTPRVAKLVTNTTMRVTELSDSSENEVQQLRFMNRFIQLV
jgi:hypothetical protein